MGLDRKFLVMAMGYAVVGMGLGLFMAASKTRMQTDTHTHVLLVGFVGSLVYAVVHKLWLGTAGAKALGKVQFGAHQVGAAALSVGLFLQYADVFSEEQMAPVLGVSSVAVLLAALLMLVMVQRSKDPAPAKAE